MTEKRSSPDTTIIGLTGAIQHGKTTVAQQLHQLELNSIVLESSMVIIEVVDAMHTVIPQPIEPQNIDWVNSWMTHLPNILRTAVRIQANFEDIRVTHKAVSENPIEYSKLFAHTASLARNPTDLIKPITAETKTLNRPLLQWLGGYLVKQVDSGIWYNELLRRARESGAVLQIISGLRFKSDEQILRRAGAHIIKVDRPDSPAVDLSDPTERERESIIADSLITNNGSVEDLAACTAIFWQDLQASKPKPFYITKP